MLVMSVEVTEEVAVVREEGAGLYTASNLWASELRHPLDRLDLASKIDGGQILYDSSESAQISQTRIKRSPQGDKSSEESSEDSSEELTSTTTTTTTTTTTPAPPSGGQVEVF